MNAFEPQKKVLSVDSMRFFAFDGGTCAGSGKCSFLLVFKKKLCNVFNADSEI